MNKLLKKLSNDLQQKLERRAMPGFKEPMLATLTKDYFSDKDWIYERKLDGVRCLIYKNKNTVSLKSRNNKELNDSYPEIVQALKAIKIDQIILDGELVTFKNRVSSFQKLQPRIGVKNPSPELIKKIKVYLYLFDVLYLDGYDTTELPLTKRKSILKQAIPFKNLLVYVIHKNKEGLAFFKQACAKHWEGIIAKKRDSIYVHDRSKYWLKFKCINQQELVIGGYTAPEGARIGFGALLVGYYQDDQLIYAGKVGTGFSDALLTDLSKQLQKLKSTKNPFTNKTAIGTAGITFIKPQLVAQIGFEEWTKGNKLRHPRFLGLRHDKKPKEVIKEKPKKTAPQPVK